MNLFISSPHSSLDVVTLFLAPAGQKGDGYHSGPHGALLRCNPGKKNPLISDPTPTPNFVNSPKATRPRPILHPPWASTVPQPPALGFWQEKLHKKKCLRQVPTFSSSTRHWGKGPQLQRSFPDADLGRHWGGNRLVSSVHGLGAHFQLQGWAGRLLVEPNPCHVCIRCGLGPSRLGRVGSLFWTSEACAVKEEGSISVLLLSKSPHSAS